MATMQSTHCEAGTRLQRALRAVRWRHRLGRFLAVLLDAAALGALLLTAYGAADFALALSPAYRETLNILLLIAVAGLILVRLVQAWRFRLAAVASMIDRESRDPRRSVEGALALSRRPEGETDLGRYLSERAIDRAADRIAAQPPSVTVPLAGLRRSGGRAALSVGLAAVVLGAAWPITSVVLPRLLDPRADRPPYSALRFEIDPAAPSVLYGDSVEIRVQIRGGRPAGPVMLATRSGPRRHELACFHVQSNLYAQTLEQVTQPLEFCFRAGRARSRWHGIDLRLQPRVAAARLEITPPAYSGKSGVAFSVGDRPLRDLRGSELRMDVLSNRPLGSGRILMREPEGSNLLGEVEGGLRGSQTLRFEWTLEEPAELELYLVDVRGTKSREPLRIEQRVLPDEPPQVAITEPNLFALATPRADLVLAGYAEDDLGLQHVRMMKALVGYRDRVERIGPPVRTQEVSFEQPIELASLGVVPGQVLEFYAEAEDANPNRLGRTASEVVRVEIIEEEEYAKMERTRVRTEEFLARYRVVREVAAAVQQAAQALKEALAEEGAAPGEREGKRDALAEALEEARSEYERLGREFPVFEAEQSLGQELRETATKLESIGARLRDAPPEGAQCRAALEQLDELFGSPDSGLNREIAKAEDIARVSRLMELATRYQRLVNEQAALVRRLEQVRDPRTLRDRRLFDWLMRTEQAIHDELEALQKNLRRRADELPDRLRDLRISARRFAEGIDGVQALTLLDEARRAALNQDGGTTKQKAKLALERMRELLSSCRGGYGEMARCSPTFRVQDPRLMPSLRQMMEAWKPGPGEGMGRGGGAGAGTGGAAEDGYWMQGFSPLNVPMYGPRRSRFASPPGGAGGRGQDGRGEAVAPVPVAADADAPAGGPVEMRRDAIQLERVPEKYREAVKRYFDLADPERTTQ